MENKELKDLILYLSEEAKGIEDEEGIMDKCSWPYQTGIIISGNDAKLIVESLSSHPFLSELKEMDEKKAEVTDDEIIDMADEYTKYWAESAVLSEETIEQMNISWIRGYMACKHGQSNQEQAKTVSDEEIEKEAKWRFTNGHGVEDEYCIELFINAITWYRDKLTSQPR